MRLVIQRVESAAVTTAAKGIVGSIEKGVCVLIGIGKEDQVNDIPWCVDKIIKTKLWPDNDGKQWKLSVADLNLKVLLVSQFTLYAKDMKKGKLDFHHAMAPAPALDLYNSIIESIKRELGSDNVESGEFGAMMQVKLLESFIDFMLE